MVLTIYEKAIHFRNQNIDPFKLIWYKEKKPVIVTLPLLLKLWFKFTRTQSQDLLAPTYFHFLVVRGRDWSMLGWRREINCRKDGWRPDLRSSYRKGNFKERIRNLLPISQVVWRWRYQFHRTDQWWRVHHYIWRPGR